MTFPRIGRPVGCPQSYEAQIKIHQAITELQTEGPIELGPDLEKIPLAIHGEQALSASRIRALLDPIIAKLRNELETTD